MPPNTDCRYQRPVGGVGEWPVGSHLGHMVPSESLVYPESTGDVDRDTQNGVLEAEICGISQVSLMRLVSRFGGVSSLPYVGVPPP